MNTRSRSVNSARMALGLFCLFAIATALGTRPAAADPVYGLENQLYVQATMSPEQQTYFNDTGWIASASPLNQTFTAVARYTDPAGYGSGEAEASATATVFYGRLDAYGGGSASPILHRYGADARAIPVTGGAPLVSYRDQLVVTSHTLAAGAPVALSFVFSFDGLSSFVSEPGGKYPSFAAIAAEFTMGDVTSGAHFDRNITTAGTYAETSTVAVGDIIDITGSLFAYGDAAAYDAAGDASFTFSDPTAEFIDVTPGAFLVSASGHDYTSPNVTRVPEPSPLPLFCLGLAGIGCMLIVRRRSTKATG